MSNTSWQHDAGETARSDFSQMVGIAVGSGSSGGLIRLLLYIVLPLAGAAAVAIVAIGVLQTRGHPAYH